MFEIFFWCLNVDDYYKKSMFSELNMRKVNRCVDWMVNWVLQGEIGNIILDELSEGLAIYMVYDRFGMLIFQVVLFRV